MIMINDYEYTTEYGHSYSCLSCGDPIEHGEVRAQVRYRCADGDEVDGWAHAECAEDEARESSPEAGGDRRSTVKAI